MCLCVCMCWGWGDPLWLHVSQGAPWACYLFLGQKPQAGHHVFFFSRQSSVEAEKLGSYGCFGSYLNSTPSNCDLKQLP